MPVYKESKTNTWKVYYHYDHADGLDTFFALNISVPFLVREGACENCFGVKEGMPMIRSLVSFRTRNA